VVNKETFNKVTELVIDNLEGGYYNPAWHSVGDPRFVYSGETMYGLDRKNGGSLNTSPAGKRFWALIDANKNKETWVYNYNGGKLAPELKKLVAEVMLPAYESYSKNSMSPKLKEIVDNDPRLLFHFIYAAWNGPGWFQKFATDMDTALTKGTHDSDGLVNVAINSRVSEGLQKGKPPDSLIRQSGYKIKDFINNIPGVLKSTIKSVEDTTEKGVEKAKQNPIPTIIISAALVIGIYTLVKHFKK